MEKLPRIDFTDFLESEYQMFYNNCNFTDRQIEILNMRRKGKSIVEISMTLCMGEATVSRELKKIKNKILRVI